MKTINIPLSENEYNLLFHRKSDVESQKEFLLRISSVLNCPKCEKSIYKVKKVDGRYMHIGKGACGSFLDKDWIENNKDSLIVLEGER